jgi:hypothetical protein
MTAADAKAWYDTWYVPNNAYVVITGDVDHKAVFALAEKYYGPLEGRALPVRKPQIEPTQEGTRRVNVKAPAELPVLIMGYKAPSLRDVDKDSDPYALEMLSAMLDGHDAARFNKKLVRETRSLFRSASITTPPRAARHDLSARQPVGRQDRGRTRSRSARRDHSGPAGRRQRTGTEARQGATGRQPGVQTGLDVRPGHGNRPDRVSRYPLPEDQNACWKNCSKVTPPTFRPSPKSTSTTMR